MRKTGAFPIIMAIIIGIFILLSIFIPLRKAYQGKNDRLIEDNLSSVKSAVDNYYRTNKELPQTLSQVDTRDRDAKKLIETNLVSYEIVDNNITNNTYNSTSYSSSSYQKTSASYILCAQYKFSKDKSRDYITDRDEYSTYVSTYSHPAGEVCYKLLTSRY